jgi:hypothetical protein
MLIDRKIAPSGVYMLHIPKTAGTSLRVYIENYFNVDEICPAYTLYEALAISKQALARYHFYRGHMGFALLALLKQLDVQPLTIAFFRDPISRSVSHFRYISRDQRHPKYRLITDHNLDLVAFLRQKPLRGELSNLQTGALAHNASAPALRQAFAEATNASSFAGAYFRNKPRLSEQAKLELALERIEKVDVVGVVESYSDSVDLVSHKLGLRPRANSQKFNVSDADTAEQLEKEAIDLLKEINRSDLELYRVAHKIMKKRHECMVKDLLETRYEKLYRDFQRPLSVIDIDFAEAISGTGWHQREHADGLGLLKFTGFHRWTGPSRISEVDLPLLGGRSYTLEVDVVDQCSPEALTAAGLAVNGRTVPHTLEKKLRSTRLISHIPASVLEGRWPVRLSIQSGAVLEIGSRRETEIDHNSGRLCGLAVSRIRLRTQ